MSELDFAGAFSIFTYRTTSDRAPPSNSTSPFEKNSLIVRSLDFYARITVLNSFWQVKILYHYSGYRYFKSRLPCSKMPGISRNCSKLYRFCQKVQKIDLTIRSKSKQLNSTPSRIVRLLGQYEPRKMHQLNSTHAH